MPVNTSDNCKFGWKAVDFNLISVDGNYYDLKSLAGQNGTVIAFICNHCPYVISVADRLKKESDELNKIGINTIAIMSNDTESYPEDSYENMIKFSKKYQFNFQYLYDSTQEIAKNYKAICTPDFYGFNKELELQYRGRIDSGTINNSKNIDRELFNSMKIISQSNKGPSKQFNSQGCSIKWKKNEY